MGTHTRRKSDVSIYHVMQRGVGRRLIFEDDVDRQRFLEILDVSLADADVSLMAWCLMDNHTHLLLSGELRAIGSAMQRLGQTYARYFNIRHDRVGHLFQDRYKSVAVDDEPQLLTAMRYIHRNPVEEGLTKTCRYRWSSYVDYLGMRKDRPVRLDTSVLEGLLPTKGEVERFHDAVRRELPKRTTRPVGVSPLPKPSESEAIETLSSVLDAEGLERMPEADRWKRNTIIRRLKERGLSIRQIERLTGIGRNIIQRA